MRASHRFAWSFKHCTETRYGTVFYNTIAGIVHTGPVRSVLASVDVHIPSLFVLAAGASPLTTERLKKMSTPMPSLRRGLEIAPNHNNDIVTAEQIPQKDFVDLDDGHTRRYH